MRLRCNCKAPTRVACSQAAGIRGRSTTAAPLGPWPVRPPPTSAQPLMPDRAPNRFGDQPAGDVGPNRLEGLGSQEQAQMSPRRGYCANIA